MQTSDITLDDGQPGYLCVKCDVFWPRSHFHERDFPVATGRRICATHRDGMTLVEHGRYRESGGGTVIGCFEPDCVDCASESRK